MNYANHRSIPMLWSIGLYVIVSTSWLSCVYAEMTIEVAIVKHQTFPHYELFDALVEASHESTVSSRIAAEVIDIGYDVGDNVPKGAVIMRFRDEEFQARVAQIDANVLAIKAQINEAMARYKEAMSEAGRITDLFNRKLMAQAALDKANADLNVARSRVDALQAQLKAHQAQLEEAQVQLSYTQITAPYSGVVTERLIEVGEMVSPGQHVMTGLSLEQLRAVVSVPQYLLTTINKATTADLILSDGRHIPAGAISIIPQADIKSHSFTIRIDLPREIDNLYPGSFAKVQFETGHEEIRVIPQSAIVQRGEVSGVYVMSPEKQLSLRQVRLGRLLDHEQREILAGLAINEFVAVNPINALQQLKLDAMNFRQ